MIADCGADPDYRFCDLENLIRRARIDLNAEIDFMKPRHGADWAHAGRLRLAQRPGLAQQPGLPGAGARRATRAAQRGQIVLVKPNVSAALPVDLVNFKAANPLFPQQPTTDQFFDEAQWESYFRLGAAIGERLDGDMLTRVAQGVPGLFVPDDGQPHGRGAAGRTPRREGQRAPSARRGVDEPAAGARAQGRRGDRLAGHRHRRHLRRRGLAGHRQLAHRSEARSSAPRTRAFKDLTERWARLRAGAAARRGAAPSLAAELLRTGDLLCREGRENFMAKFRLSVRIVDDAKAACASEPPGQRTPACARLLDPNNGIDCLQPAQAPPCAPRYWARDYTGQTRLQAELQRHPAGAVAGGRLAARQAARRASPGGGRRPSRSRSPTACARTPWCTC